MYQPSFHRDVCVTVRDFGDVGEVELVVADVHARGRVMHAIGVKGGIPPEECPVPTAPEKHRALLAPDDLAAFRSAMATLDVGALVDRADLAIDGMTVRGEWSDARGAGTFRAWSPHPKRCPVHSSFVMAIHALATRHLPDDSVQRALEQLLGYLGDDLPLRDLGGSPRHVRLFGRLSFPAHGDLVAFFRSAADDAPLVMDLRDFESMGTALYPLFRTFDRRPGPTAWCASPHARVQLRAAGIPAERIFDDLDAARAAVRLTPADS
jgi:hypothetical protein